MGYLLHTLSPVHIHLGVETKLMGPHLSKVRKLVKQAGLRSFCRPAQPTVGEFPSGGEWALIKKHLTVVSSHQGVHWQAITVRFKKRDVTFVSVYLETGQDPLSEANQQRLDSLAQYLRTLKGPWIALGDWNCTPCQLIASEFVPGVQGSVVVPTDVSFTCWGVGKPSLIDFAVVSKCMVGIFSLRADFEGVWATHYGLHWELNLDPGQNLVRTLQPSPPVPTVYQGPTRARWDEMAQYAATEHQPDSILEIRYREPNEALTQAFRTWSLKAGLTIADKASAWEKREVVCRKGGEHIFVWSHPVPTNRLGDRFKAPALSLFASLESRLVEYDSLERHKLQGKAAKGVRQQSRSLGQWLAQQVGRVIREWPFPPDPERGYATRDQLVHDLVHASRTLPRDRALRQVRVITTKLTRIEQDKAHTGYREFLEAQLAKGGKALHTIMKQEGTESDDLQFQEAQKWGVTPLERVSAKEKFWRGKWTGIPVDEPTRQRLRLAAREADLPEPLRDGAVASCVDRAPRQSGLGADQWGVSDWAQLPFEAKRDLAAMLNTVEETLSWPRQVLLNLVALLPKPAGGDRPIVLTASLYRLWSRLRKFLVSSWESEHRDFWDTAIKGSSALMAAILREAKNEICHHLDIDVIQFLWDGEKFYDSINTNRLINLSLDQDYPAHMLELGIQVHSADRVLVSDGCCSEPIGIEGRSIIAGCMQSTTLTKALLHDMLDHLHRRYRPVSIQSYVDDLAQRHQGKGPGLAKQAVQCAAELVDLMGELGVSMSPKSALQASTPVLSSMVQQELAALDISLRNPKSVRDLGLDSTIGKSRIRPVAKHRLWRGVLKGRKLKQFVQANKKARRLFKPAIKSVSLWGHQYKGVAPQELATYRARMARVLCLDKPGGCTTTAILLSQGPRGDPTYQVVLETLRTWFQIWEALPTLRLAINKVWGTLVERLANPSSRWRRVTGPISAVVATVYQIGWKPTAPLQWQDIEGEDWHLDPSKPELRFQLQQHLVRQIDLLLWKKASRHRFGQGSESGVDWTVPKQRLQSANKSEDNRTWGLTRMICMAGLWEPARVADATGEQPQECPYCGVPLTMRHQVYECPWIKGFEDPDIQSTNYLCEEACRVGEETPCFWYRGLVPWNWTFGKVEKEVAEKPIYQHQKGPWAPGRWNLPAGAIGATDGSGGIFSSDPRVRRVGWGAVIGTRPQNGRVIQGWAMGTLEGLQTVPRAELRALVWIASMTDGDIEIAVDASYVVKGYEKGERHLHLNHQDLWGQLWAAVDHRVGSIRLVWTKSHPSAAYLSKHPEVPEWQYHMNAWADAFADRAAEIGLLDLGQSVVRDIRSTDIKANNIMKRLVAATKAWQDFATAIREWLEEAGAQFEPPTNKTPAKRRAQLLETAITDSCHVIERHGRALRCKECMTGVKAGATMLCKLSWAETPCTPAIDHRYVPQLKGVGVHASHSPMMYRGVIYCAKCGGWKVRKSAKLIELCQSPTAGGKALLRAIEKGRLPAGLAARSVQVLPKVGFTLAVSIKKKREGAI